MEEERVYINTPIDKRTKIKLQKIARETERSLAAVVRYYMFLGLDAEKQHKNTSQPEQT